MSKTWAHTYSFNQKCGCYTLKYFREENSMWGTTVREEETIPCKQHREKSLLYKKYFYSE